MKSGSTSLHTYAKPTGTKHLLKPQYVFHKKQLDSKIFGGDFVTLSRPINPLYEA